MPFAAILALDGCYASSLAGFADVLQVANAHLRKQRAPASAYFEWRFVSLSGKPVVASNGLPIAVRDEVADRPFDLIFIPSLHYGGRKVFERFLGAHAHVYEWLKSEWQRGAWLAANCTGTFALAETGLLDGRVATTTWWLEQQFRSRYPLVDLRPDPVITEADRLICAGASASYLLQAIRVVERFSGAAIASRCAKTMLIDISQTSQTPYLPLISEKEHSDALVRRAQHWLIDHLSEPLRVPQLATRLAVSERTLIRRFNAALGESPLTYLQNLRIDTARAMLEGTGLGVEDIASRVGYIDSSSFSRLFKGRIGLSPGAYRARFQFGKTQIKSGA
ncbi:transcriptional regulator [Pandoraea terrae]|uniref:Transcriptional regulator n=1 Tax=Pandoraea terrae TaxID=1537710 RepID=A0A5E4UA58_9BURK|nr:helix-turn-helix domain-containing protein [Pandoraea terrae]VVD96523.1 transcriptional regulator [Pandoraea terrae]